MSDMLLDQHEYDDNYNEWKPSTMRAWLNNDFINATFSKTAS